MITPEMRENLHLRDAAPDPAPAIVGGLFVLVQGEDPEVPRGKLLNGLLIRGLSPPAHGVSGGRKMNPVIFAALFSYAQMDSVGTQ